MILIIGGGIAGLAIGWRLAQAGEQVTVLEKGRLGRCASWAAAGILFPEAKQTAFGALTAVSHSLWPDFVTELEAITTAPQHTRRTTDFGANGRAQPAPGHRAIHGWHSPGTHHGTNHH